MFSLLYQPQMTRSQAKDAIANDWEMGGAFWNFLAKVTSDIAYVDPWGTMNNEMMK